MSIAGVASARQEGARRVPCVALLACASWLPAQKIEEGPQDEKRDEPVTVTWARALAARSLAYCSSSLPARKGSKHPREGRVHLWACAWPV